VTIDTRIAPVAGDTSLNIQWSAIIAGAIGAAALAFILHSFAAAIGISLSSTAPTWRDASFALVFLSGLYLVLTALASYSFGAYIAARLRVPFTGAPADAEFRDGMQGLLVWALATLLTGLIAVATINAVPRLTAPTSASASVAGENVIAFDLDRLFRAARPPAGNMDYVRSEAARILLTTTSHSGMQADDRTYLVRLVMATTGLAQPDAERRVDDVAARARDDLNRARRSAVILGFMVGAAALAGAIAAWYAACAAGRHRDGREALDPFWDWGRPVNRFY
jgi:predicted transcriptional regulator